MAVMRVADFPELMDTPLRKIFFMAVDDVPAEYPRWVNLVETRRNFEDDLRMAEFGTVPQHAEGSVVLFEDALEGQTKRYTPLEFALGYQITQTALEDELHGIFAQMTRALRKSFRNLFEVQAYNILNNSTSTASTRFTGFDGLALLNNAHPNLGNSDTQANTQATAAALSQAAVEVGVRTMHQWTGEKGLPAFFTPRMAIIDSDDQFLAARIFRNAMKFDTANNEDNWIRRGPDSNGIDRYLTTRYFTSANQWYIMPDKSEHSLNLFTRIHPQFETGSDLMTGNFIVKGRSRLISSFSHWIGPYGNSGF